MVPQPPSWPVLSAASRSATSAPRTSPTTSRSGRIRSACRTRSRTVDLAGTLDVGRPGLERDDVRMVRAQLAGVLDEDDAARRADEAEQGRQQRGLARAGAAADQEGEPRRDHGRCEEPGPGAVSDPAATSSSRVNAVRAAAPAATAPCPGRATGASTAWKRVPSGSRTSTYGVASSRRRPPAAASRCARRRTAASSGNRTSVALQPGAPVDVDLVGAVDQHVGDAGHPQQRLERTGTDHVPPQRVVDGEHRASPTGRPGRAQRLRHPLRA